MDSYKGFSPEQRWKMHRLSLKKIENGELKNPLDCSCEMCGQDRGVIEYHAKSYDPDIYFDKGNLIPLCFKCHRRLHVMEKGEGHKGYEQAKEYFQDVIQNGPQRPVYTKWYTREIERKRNENK